MCPKTVYVLVHGNQGRCEWTGYGNEYVVTMNKSWAEPLSTINKSVRIFRGADVMLKRSYEVGHTPDAKNTRV